MSSPNKQLHKGQVERQITQYGTGKGRRDGEEDDDADVRHHCYAEYCLREGATCTHLTDDGNGGGGRPGDEDGANDESHGKLRWQRHSV